MGVQYGLRALIAGKITPAQFVDLNAKVGSVDIDYVTQPGQRIEADPAAIATAYRSGVLNEGNNLDRVPIIDIPVPGDRYEIHDNYKSWALRARLVQRPHSGCLEAGLDLDVRAHEVKGAPQRLDRAIR